MSLNFFFFSKFRVKFEYFLSLFFLKFNFVYFQYCPLNFSGFEELTCYCGAEVIHPPVPCGTKPPECSKLCTKPHACDHPGWFQ